MHSRRLAAIRWIWILAAIPLLTAAQPASGPAQEPALDHAKSLSKAFRAAAERAKPTVVKITTFTKAREMVRGGENPFRGTPFEEFFGDDFQRYFENMPRRPQNGLGSGVIIRSDGLILTNNHVVSGADEVMVRLSDGRELKATGIKTDEQTDLAILRVESENSLPYAPLGDSSRMDIGDWVIAIGHPFELEATVSAGIISGKGRSLGSIRRAQFLQTDAAINPGNSGGPLVNLDGEVVGINTAIATSSGGYQGIGFAIPSNLAKWVVGQLVEKGSVQRAYLGVGIEELTVKLAEKLGFRPGSGVLVSEVYPDTPAARAQFQEGDLIVEFAGSPVRNPRQLQAVVERSPLGSRVPVRVMRNGRSVALSVVLEALPEDQPASSRPDVRRTPQQSLNTFSAEELGIEVTELSSEVAERLGYRGHEGVLITRVDPNSVAYREGLRERMLVLRVGRQKVTSIDDFKAAIRGESLQEGILLQVRAGSGNRFLVIQQR